MLRFDEWYRSLRSFLPCVAAAAAVTAAATPAAGYERSCHFVVEVNPTDNRLESALYSFRAFTTVERLIDANDARRDVRQHVSNCVVGHWNDRNETRPYACQDAGRIDMAQYPFENMVEEIRQDICDANRDEVRLPVNITMFIRGERGCLERSEDQGVDPVAWVNVTPAPPAHVYPGKSETDAVDRAAAQTLQVEHATSPPNPHPGGCNL